MTIKLTGTRAFWNLSYPNNERLVPLAFQICYLFLRLQIIDFDVARFWTHTTIPSGVKGTYRWMSPEVNFTWWRHQMETFIALLALWAGNSPVTGEFPTQRPATRSFDVFFHLRLNKRLSKQSRGWWFETPSFPLWLQRNVVENAIKCAQCMYRK